MKQPHLLHVATNSQKLKFDRNFFGWTWSKMGVANLVSGLNLNVFQELTDILHAGTNSCKLKKD